MDVSPFLLFFSARVSMKALRLGKNFMLYFRYLKNEIVVL